MANFIRSQNVERYSRLIESVREDSYSALMPAGQGGRCRGAVPVSLLGESAAHSGHGDRGRWRLDCWVLLRLAGIGVLVAFPCGCFGSERTSSSRQREWVRSRMPRSGH